MQIHFPSLKLEIHPPNLFYNVFYDFIMSSLKPEVFIVIFSDLLTQEYYLLYPFTFPVTTKKHSFSSINSILEYYASPQPAPPYPICWKKSLPSQCEYLFILESSSLNYSNLWEYCNVVFTDFIYHCQIFENHRLIEPYKAHAYFTYLRHSIQEIQKKLESLYQASANLNQQLQRSQKMIVIGELAPIVASALSEPMQNIQEYSELLNNSLPLLTVQIPHLLQKLNAQEEKLFWELLDKVSTLPSSPNSNSKDNSVSLASNLHEKLVAFGILEFEERFLLLSESIYRNKILYLLEKVKVFWQNINYIRKSVEKVFEILTALEHLAKSTSTTPVLVEPTQTFSLMLAIYNSYFPQGITVEKSLDHFPQIYGYPQLLIQMWFSLCWHCLAYIGYQGKLHIRMQKKDNQSEIYGIACRNNNEISFQDSLPTHAPQVLSLEKCNTIASKHGGLLTIKKKEKDQIEFWLYF